MTGDHLTVDVLRYPGPLPPGRSRWCPAPPFFPLDQLLTDVTAGYCELHLRVLPLRYCCPAVHLCRACSISATRETITTPPPNIYSSRHRFSGTRRRGNPSRLGGGAARGVGPTGVPVGPTLLVGCRLAPLCPGQTVTGVPSSAEACRSEPGMPGGVASGRARQVKPS
ncbi:hypothetical protein CVT30_07075 [Streptomyces sp. AMCC400023]|nr:hypothetical protein CVT30_07075 [Streptomyces sp. AMCC400023]